MPQSKFIQFELTEYNRELIHEICGRLQIEPERSGAFIEAVNYALRFTVYHEGLYKRVRAFSRFQREQLDKKIDGEALYDRFIGQWAIMKQVAAMDVEAMIQRVAGLRGEAPDEIDMSDREVANAILRFARSY